MARDTEQQAPSMQAEPQKEHEWLEQLVGDWTFEVEAPKGPGEAPERFSGSETVRSLGGLWFVAEGEGEMPGGGKANTILTLGYDPAKQRYVGTWIGSMMTHLWTYEGEVSADGKKLTLDTEGPDMEMEGKLAQYREAIEFKSNDHRVFTSQVLKDGNWRPMMTANYRRR